MNTTQEQSKPVERTTARRTVANGRHRHAASAATSSEHFVQFYEDDEYLVESVAAFIGAGLGGGDGAIVIATPEHREALAARMKVQGIDLDAMHLRGQYIPLDAAETLSKFMVDGSPDETLFREVVGGLVAKVAKGRSALRAFGEMVALLWADGNGTAAIHLEKLWNSLGEDYAFSLFCAYPINGFKDAIDSAPFLHICNEHSHVIPAESFSLDGGTDDQQLRAIAMLQQKAAALEAEIAERTVAQQTVARREQELRDFLETATEGIHQVGPDGTILWANKAELELLGYAPEEYIGHSITKFHADGMVIAEILARLTRGEKLCSYEARLKHKDGSIRYVSINSSGHWDGDRFLHTKCFTRDITEKKLAEEALARSRHELAVQVEDLQRLHERSSRLAGIHDLNEILQEVLHAALAVHGTDRGLLSLFDREREMLDIVASKGFSAEFLEMARRVPIEGGARGMCFREKRRIVVEDAETDPLWEPYREMARLGGFRAAHCMPLVTADGTIIGVLSVHFAQPRRPSEREIRLVELYARYAADATESARLRDEIQRELEERRRTEAALRHTQEIEQRLAAIVESSEDAIISKDLNGVIASWNRGAQDLFGYTAEEVIGKPVTILMPPEKFNEEPGILDRIRRGLRIEHYETVRRRKDGTLLNISLTVSPIKDADGKVIGASKVARDITDKIRAKEKLEQTVAERTAQLRDTVAELEAFSYSVAHDMRAPLRSMNSYSRFLMEDYAEVLPPKGKDYVRRIASGASRLDFLITDVLNYSKISRGEMRLESVDVEKLTRDIIDSYESLRESGATILVQSPLPHLVGNSAALTQSISNLLSNAVKFIRPGVMPQVRIWAEKKSGSDFVRLWFEDNGIGISEQGQKRIFHMFQRLNPAGEFEGTGIGLTIVRKAVERMGGRVGVESQPGVGSRFWIELKPGA